jgi:hypothetical protein
MIINLSPVNGLPPLVVVKTGDVIVINDVRFDFSFVKEGDRLPSSAVETSWLAIGSDVSRTNGSLELTLVMPVPSNANEAQSFPVPLGNVPDGVIKWPDSDPDEDGNVPSQPQPDPDAEITEGVIDKTQLITKAMIDAEILAEQTRVATDQLNALTRQANAQVTALAGRVATLDFLVNGQDEEDPDYIAPTAADVAELTQRKTQLKQWNTYNVKLGKVKAAAGWPATPTWPVMPEPYNNETSAVSAPTS